jgi:hypothetical protein
MPIAEHKKTGSGVLSPLKESLEEGFCLVLVMTDGIRNIKSKGLYWRDTQEKRRRE